MKKIFLILIVLLSFSFIYSSCKEEDNDNNSNVDLYSSKKMEGRYIESKTRDSIDYELQWNSLNVRSVCKESLCFYSIRGNDFYYYKMDKKGNIINGGYPYYFRGKIKYIPIGNPVFPYAHYEIEGAYFSDTAYTDTILTTFLKQISYDTMPWHSK